MKDRWHVGAGARGAALLTLALMVPGTTGAQQAEAYRVAGRRVAVYNLAGSVEIVPGSGADVVVHVTTRGDDADRLNVVVGDVGGRPALRVLYPGDEIVYPEMGRGSRSETRVRDDGTFGDGSGGGDRLTIRGTGSGLEAYADLRIEVPAGRFLEAFIAVGEATARDITGDLSIDTGSGSVEASGIRGELMVDTGSGSITVMDVLGDVSLDTGSGGVRIDDVEGGRIVVDTGSGSVRGGGLSAGSVHVDTGSGRIELMGVRSREVLVDTGSGSVDIELLADVDALEVDTGSGSVTVVIPAGLGAEIEVDTGSGSIDLDVPVELRTMRRTHVQGVIGDGAGQIRIDTGSGSVHVRRN